MSASARSSRSSGLHTSISSPSPSASTSRSASYSLRTPPAIKVDYVQRLGSPRKRVVVSNPSVRVASVKKARTSIVGSVKVEPGVQPQDVVAVENILPVPASTIVKAEPKSQVIMPPDRGPVQILGVFVIESIVARSLYQGYNPDMSGRRGYQYLVRWAGYGPADDTWEMESELRVTAGALLQEFDAQPIQWRIIQTRTESKQRQFLVRIGPHDDTSPHAEEEWLTRWTMREQGLESVDARVDAWVEANPEQMKATGLAASSTGGMSGSRSSTRIREVAETARLATSSVAKRRYDAHMAMVKAKAEAEAKAKAKAQAKAKKSKAKANARARSNIEAANAAPPYELVEIINTTKYKAKYNSPHMSMWVTVSYRHSGTGESGKLLQGTFDRSFQLPRMFGQQRCIAALAEWREGMKVDQEAVRQAQLDNEYEIERKRRIEENMAMMKELGLGLN